MDRGAWWAAVHGVAGSATWLSNFTFTFHFHALEKEMATHSSVLAWRIPWMGEPGGLPSMGSHRVGYDWSNLAAAAAVSRVYQEELKSLFGGSKITADGDCSHEIRRHLLLGRRAMTNLHINMQRHYFTNKGPSSQGYGLSSSHLWMWELDCEKSWVSKNWCFWTVVLEDYWESLGLQEIQPVNSKGNQPLIFIGTDDA